MEVHISIPFNLLREKYLNQVLELRVSPEISIKAEDLDTLSRKEFKEIADILKREALKPSIHLPFMDLSLAALDPWIRKVSLKRLFWGMEIAALFEPKIAVFHSGYHPDYHRDQRLYWREIFMTESLPSILEHSLDLGLNLALENVFEPDPEFLAPLFSEFKERLSWCFDPAHARVFSERNELDWLSTLYPYIKEMHCHDNLGKWDDHLPLGKGVINFGEIFRFLKAHHCNPLLTIEAKKEEDVLVSYQYLQNFCFQS